VVLSDVLVAAGIETILVREIPAASN
jgi:hypothetical protein